MFKLIKNTNNSFAVIFAQIILVLIIVTFGFWVFSLFMDFFI